MFGAIAKTYYAQKLGVDPKDMVVVAKMCIRDRAYACYAEMGILNPKDPDKVCDNIKEKLGIDSMIVCLLYTSRCV